MNFSNVLSGETVGMRPTQPRTLSSSPAPSSSLSAVRLAGAVGKDNTKLEERKSTQHPRHTVDTRKERNGTTNAGLAPVATEAR